MGTKKEKNISVRICEFLAAAARLTTEIIGFNSAASPSFGSSCFHMFVACLMVQFSKVPPANVLSCLTVNSRNVKKHS